jgi:drug/metabolite transporter (DMT)-like permease
VTSPDAVSFLRSRAAGPALVLVTAVISGVAVFTNSYGVRAFGDPTVYTTAKNLVAAVVLAAALLAVPLLRDRIGPWHLAAIALLVWGQAVLGGGVRAIGFGTGEAMILAATVLWSVEVIVAKWLPGGCRRSPSALRGWVLAS